jgi:hypothetical protein
MESALSVLLDFLDYFGNSILPHTPRSFPLPLGSFITAQPVLQMSYIQLLSTPTSVVCKLSQRRYHFLCFHWLFEGSLQTWTGLYQATYSIQSSLILISASAAFLLSLTFHPEDGGNMFLRNVGLSLNYWHYYPEGHTLHSQCRKNLKSTAIILLAEV